MVSDHLAYNACNIRYYNVSISALNMKQTYGKILSCDQSIFMMWAGFQVQSQLIHKYWAIILELSSIEHVGFVWVSFYVYMSSFLSRQ